MRSRIGWRFFRSQSFWVRRSIESTATNRSARCFAMRVDVKSAIEQKPNHWEFCMATQSIQIEAQSRSAMGTRANRKLRETGQIPGVVYGHKEAVVPVTLPKKELTNHLHHGAHLFDLALDGKPE